jgi:prepilin-type N-terminal cleavage/methylation domain-containing protein
MKHGRGFTLVELMVVVVVIAILASLATLGINKYLEDGRDTKRAANAMVISQALERYYDQNGEYPSCTAITGSGSSVSTTVLKGIDPSALLVPDADASVTNSIECTSLDANSTDDFFEYEGDGSANCTGSVACTSFILSYRSEGDNTIKAINSRQTVGSVAPGAFVALKAPKVSFTSATLTWPAVSNSIGYTLQQATNGGFTENLVTTTLAKNNTAVTGLSEGATYYFRVKPLGTDAPVEWSNTRVVTPPVLGAPAIVSIQAHSTSQMAITWQAAENADTSTTYSVQRSLDARCTQVADTYTGLSGTSQVISGVTPGQNYYYRIQAVTTSVNPAYASAFSICRAVTPAAPKGLAAWAASATKLNLQWQASSYAASYIVHYGQTADAAAFSQAAAGLEAVVSNAIAKNTTYYVSVSAVGQDGIEGPRSLTIPVTTPE